MAGVTRGVWAVSVRSHTHMSEALEVIPDINLLSAFMMPKYQDTTNI